MSVIWKSRGLFILFIYFLAAGRFILFHFIFLADSAGSSDWFNCHPSFNFLCWLLLLLRLLLRLLLMLSWTLSITAFFHVSQNVKNAPRAWKCHLDTWHSWTYVTYKEPVLPFFFNPAASAVALWRVCCVYVSWYADITLHPSFIYPFLTFTD